MESVLASFHCNRMCEKKQEFLLTQFPSGEGKPEGPAPIHGCRSLSWVLRLGGLRRGEMKREKDGEKEKGMGA